MSTPKPPNDLDEELGELPPLDGPLEHEGDDSSDRDRDESLDGLDPDEGASGNPFDDSTGEDESPDTRDLALDPEEKSWLDEAAETPDLELGDMPLVSAQIEGESGLALDEQDEPTVDDEDVGLADTSPKGGLDSGDEGPLDADEELRDEDLPALDADEEGEPDDAGFVDERFVPTDPIGLPWAAVQWSRLPLTAASLDARGATAIACTARGAIVAVVAARAEVGESAGGYALTHIDLDGATHALEAAGLEKEEVLSLAAGGATEPELVAVVMRNGRVAVSMDSGLSFAFRESLRSMADVAFTPGALWVRTQDGALLRAGEPALASRVAAIAPVGHRLAGLVLQEDRRPEATLLVGDSGGPSPLGGEPIFEMLAGDAPESAVPALFATRGGHLAYAGRAGVVRRGADGAWKSFAWGGRVAALSFIDDHGTLLAAIYLDADDSTTLVRVDPQVNQQETATIVGRVDAPHEGVGSDGRVLGMALDDTRRVVWLAGGFGVAAFAIAD